MAGVKHNNEIMAIMKKSINQWRKRKMKEMAINGVNNGDNGGISNGGGAVSAASIISSENDGINNQRWRGASMAWRK
jgi:hypothetical protein